MVQQTVHARQTDKLVKGGYVVFPHGLTRMDILISRERVQALVEPGSADNILSIQETETIDATGQIIFSGIIDTHVHFNTGTSHCDTIQEATKAAALGGTTTILGHIRSMTGDVAGEIDRQRELVQECPIDVAFHAILTAQDDLPTVVPALIKRGVRSFKLFMAYQREGLGMDDQGLYMAFRQIAESGGLPIVHAENQGMITALEAELVAAGRTAVADYPASRAVYTEVEAVRRALWLAELARSPVYFAHVSSIAALDLVAREKQRLSLDAECRRPVYAESCPKYLLLDDGAYRTLGGRAVVAPPLRNSEQRQALFRALLSGAIDALGSDHSPHPAQLKEGTTFPEIRPGAPGAQTLFPVMLSRMLEEEGAMATGAYGLQSTSESAVKEHPLWTLQRTASLCPAKILSLYPRKGWLGPAADADLVFVEPHSSWEVTMDWLTSNSGFSLYEGRQLQGRAVHSMVCGRWVMRDGHLVGEKGGQYLGR